MITHRSSSDPKHAFHSGSVQVYKCPVCGREEAKNSNEYLSFGVSSWCPDCETKGKVSRMKTHTRIQEQATDEIRNRVVTEEVDKTPSGMTREQLWDEGLVMPVSHSFRPLAGKGRCRIEAKWSKTAYLDRAIKMTFTDIEGKDYEWIVSLADLGGALEGVI